MRPEVVGPHGRLGFVWAVLTVAGAVAGPPWLAVWLGSTAGLAAAQVARSRRRARRGNHSEATQKRLSSGVVVVVAGAGAASVTLSAAAGPVAVAVGAGAVLAVTLGCGFLARDTADVELGDVALLSVTVVMIGLSGAAPVLLRASTGLVPVLVLLAYAMAYDASAYVVGSGASNGWDGPAAGIAATGTVTLTVAAVLAPPFRGSSPWLLGGLAAVLAPMGPILASSFPGDRKVRVPALLRMDSLLLLAPLWSLAAALLVS